MPAQLSKQEFVKRAQAVHGECYDYTNTIMRPNPQFIEVRCRVHGDFSQRAGQHISGKGCKKCASQRNGENHRRGKEAAIKKLLAVHGTKYGYDLLPDSFITVELVPIVCQLHGVFMQTIDAHRTGRGCPTCGDITRVIGRKQKGSYMGWGAKRFIKSAEASGSSTLYLVRCYNDQESFFKIGVTSKVDVRDRFPCKIAMPYKFDVLKQIQGASPAVLFKAEQGLKKQFFSERYLPNIGFAGHTECFNVSANIVSAFNAL